MTDTSAIPTATRYAHAAAAAPALLLPRLIGSSVDGYWIDSDRYFFLGETLDDAGGVVETPMIADAALRNARPAIDAHELLTLLEAGGVRTAPETLRGAQYDMPDPGRLAVTIRDTAYLFDVEPPRLKSERALHSGAQLYSPDHRHAVFLDGHDLWLLERSTGQAQALTNDGAPLNAYARQPESGLATLSYRAASYPLGLWSPDSQWLLTHRCDERALPDLPMVQHVPPGGGRPILRSFKMSAVGDPPATMVLVAIHVASGLRVESSPMPLYAFSPIAGRTTWFTDNRRFCYLRSDRFHTLYELVEVDLNTGEERLLLAERVEHGYLDLHPTALTQPNVRTLARTDEVIWFSERDGWGHLYLHDAGSSAPKARITTGEWQVRDIVHVDEERRRVLFTAGTGDSGDDPGLRRLCAARFDGGEVKTLLAHDGDLGVRAEPNGPVGQDRPFRPSLASVSLGGGGRYVVARRTRLDQPSRTVIADLDAGTEFAVAQGNAALQPQTSPRAFQALAADGSTVLHGALFLPAGFDQGRRYPVIDYIYPGPQVAWLPRASGTHVGMQAQALAELGAVVIVLDSRGVPFRSRAGHQAGYGDLLEPQLSDHAAVIAQLCRRHAFLDADHVGIIGSSGGGTAAARALFDYSDTFHVGIALCGSHDPLNYHSVWMDKYVGPDASGTAHVPWPRAGMLKGKLMLIGGDMDENVHIAHLLKLADALIRANKDFDMLVVPNAGHALQLSSAYVQRRIWDYFTRHLIGREPPTEFQLAYDGASLARVAKVIARDAAW